VKLVCGPPAAGKTTHVRAHAGPGDIVVDLDAIAQERGYGRYPRPPGAVTALLQERNRRLAALAGEPCDRVAWVILAAPSRCLRKWWCETLAVQAGDLLVLAPSRDELRRRIVNDPDRKFDRQTQFETVDKWFARERADDPGVLRWGADVNGWPLDPLHPLNRER
jgi:5-methylcytosine-specific restriction protein A